MAMASWRRFLVSGIGALSQVGAGTVGVGAQPNDTLIEFDSMTPVTGAAVGTVNDRGITGGGLPWAITAGSGELNRQGHIEVMVTGLVIPVSPFNGINPVPSFKATVSCITPHGVVNVSTANFPANTAGNSTINGTVDLPHPCKHPIVFVVAPSGQWFAMSNLEHEH
jgi:hypothetical protein